MKKALITFTGFLLTLLLSHFSYAQSCTLGPRIDRGEATVGDCTTASAPLSSSRPDCAVGWAEGTVLDSASDLGGAPGCMADRDCTDLSFAFHDCIASPPPPAAGEQNRTVECRDSNGFIIGDSFCNAVTRPIDTQTCGGCTITAGQTWNASGNTCAADNTVSIPAGGSSIIQDGIGPATGDATWSCSAVGVLSGPTGASCNLGLPGPYCGGFSMSPGDGCCIGASLFTVGWATYDLATECCASSSTNPPGIAPISSPLCSPPVCTNCPYGSFDNRALESNHSTATACDTARLALGGGGHTCHTCRGTSTVEHQLWRDTGANTSCNATASDARIKTNIHFISRENGFNVYEYNYIGQPGLYRGVMAQEVMLTRPDAIADMGLFLGVYYDLINVKFQKIK